MGCHVTTEAVAAAGARARDVLEPSKVFFLMFFYINCTNELFTGTLPTCHKPKTTPALTLAPVPAHAWLRRDGGLETRRSRALKGIFFLVYIYVSTPGLETHCVSSPRPKRRFTVVWVILLCNYIIIYKMDTTTHLLTTQRRISVNYI
jgi:hypothetical protein